MTAAIIHLDEARHWRAFRAHYPAPSNDPPVDRAQTLEAGLRAFLAVDDALEPWADSVLIAQLVTASPAERAAIVRELEERRP